ncbi:hypothetical protein V8G57_11640 [Collimonas sp. H4R21]|uniref:Uncharacterized protein n=1 Tax=Collimonas rhizosphaerae TaxID=3126357 RepID=A0ABU9PVJ8_9BURK
MSSFLDNLLARNLSKPADSDTLSGNTQEWLRPRTPSLFEPALPGTGGPAMQDTEEDESHNAGATPHRNSDPRRQGHYGQVRLGAVPAALGATPLPGSARSNAAPDFGQEPPGNSAAAGQQSDAPRFTPARIASMPGVEDAPVIEPGGSGRNRRRTADNIDETAGFDTRLRSTESQLRNLVRRSAPEVRPSHEAGAERRDEARTRLAAPAPSRTAAMPSTPFNAVSQAALDSALRSQLQARAGQSRSSAAPRGGIHGSAGESGAGQRTSNIQVSIGRIEIRAASAGTPAPSPTRKERPAPQAIGLDEYLRQRASGGRE